jgi:hypothetical protein
MPDRLIPRGKGLWLARVYLRTVWALASRSGLAVLFSRPSCRFTRNLELRVRNKTP